MYTSVGKNIKRKESWEKVTGKAVYSQDVPMVGTLIARILTSPYAHARIINIDASEALVMPGVKEVVTGIDCAILFGVLLQDRPALAIDRVRYTGEPVAIVIAIDEASAEAAVRSIKVDYAPLPFVIKPSDSLNPSAPLIHEKLSNYKKVDINVFPQENTNIASKYRIRKGDIVTAFKDCEIITHQRYYLPPSDHMAMEVRSSCAEILADGTVIITTSSQAPYSVRTQISDAFKIPAGKINVKVPFVGGAFGGKAAVTLEILAYIASRKVNGKAVRVIITREQDMAMAPCRIGLEAEIKLGATKDGMLKAAEITYLLDCGAYTDISPNMSKAMAVDCTGPYNIENVSCNSLCVYTNHTYTTSYRSFAHESYTFCIERAIDTLAKECGIDPMEFRLKNAIRPGNLTPTQVTCTPGIIGDLTSCIEKIKTLSGWSGGKAYNIKKDIVKSMGMSCFWKTENPPTDAISGALITFNSDGSLNLNTGVVEMGCGGQTHLAQMLAEKLGIDINQVHVVMPVDTRLCPEHWKTVASLTEYMAGNAVIKAAEDIIDQLKIIGSKIFCCNISNIEVENGKVYSNNSPSIFICFKDIVNGFKTKDGTSIGEPVLGRGGYMLKGLTTLDPSTGKGKTGPAWTVGAQIVEVEIDIKTYEYRLIKACTVIDVGSVINPGTMRAMVAGGMSMGLSMSSREVFSYNQDGILQTPNLRTYKSIHFGQEPEYRVDFVETPEDNSPFGVRSYAEHGIIGIPAALANALSAALNREITELPLTPEKLWNISKEDKNDPI